MRLTALALALAGTAAQASPELGTIEGRCRADEPGPAVRVAVEGLKDRKGLVRVELYPPDDDGFLADDNKLIPAGRVFRRAGGPVPPSGPVTLCVRAPAPGTYTLAVIHDREANRKFSLLQDGIGFPGNPKLGHSKPPASAAMIQLGSGVSEVSIRLNYYNGFFSFTPIRQR